MIGQSVINIKSGGRGRLSTLFAGLFLLFLTFGSWGLGAPDPYGRPRCRHDNGFDWNIRAGRLLKI